MDNKIPFCFTGTIIILIILACTPLTSTNDEPIISEATTPSEAFTNPNTYYISNQGDNDADGRTRETAFQTISQAKVTRHTPMISMPPCKNGGMAGYG